MVKSPVNAAEPSARVFVIAREPRSRFRLLATVIVAFPEFGIDTDAGVIAGVPHV